MDTNRKLQKIGPFGAAAEKVDKIAANLYFSRLYMQTIQEFQKAEQEYEKAVLDGDAQNIKKAQQELMFIEEIMKLSAINYDKYTESESPPEKVSD